MDIATRLEKAARLIEKRGLAYGMLENGKDGPVCLLGAIQRAGKPVGSLSYPTKRNKAVYWLAKVIKESEPGVPCYGTDESVVLVWNDLGDYDENHNLIRRTPDQAVDMLRKAAKLYREQA